MLASPYRLLIVRRLGFHSMHVRLLAMFSELVTVRLLAPAGLLPSVYLRATAGLLVTGHLAGVRLQAKS